MSYLIVVSLIWTILFAAILGYSIDLDQKSIASLVHKEAETTIEEIITGAPGQVWLEGNGGIYVTMKFEIETQQVKILSAQSLASRAVASLAWCGSNPGYEA